MKYDEINKNEYNGMAVHLDQMPPAIGWVEKFLTPKQCDDIVKYGKSLFTTKGKIEAQTQKKLLK